MFLPRSFIWKWLGNEWFVTEKASALFAVSSLLTLVLTVVLYIGVPSSSTLSTASIVLYGVVGFVCPLAMFFLWIGMLRFWTRGEPSNRAARRIWFIVLILGLCYGAILYYAFVYMPTVRRKSRVHLEGAAS
jgi:amino acid transporter